MLYKLTICGINQSFVVDTFTEKLDAVQVNHINDSTVSFVFPNFPHWAVEVLSDMVTLGFIEGFSLSQLKTQPTEAKK